MVVDTSPAVAVWMIVVEFAHWDPSPRAPGAGQPRPARLARSVSREMARSGDENSAADPECPPIPPCSAELACLELMEEDPIVGIRPSQQVGCIPDHVGSGRWTVQFDLPAEPA